MKKSKTFLLATVICLSLTTAACSGQVTSAGATSAYNSELGYSVSLGMAKKDVDKMLGDSTEGFYYNYPNGLGIEYADGYVTSINLSGYRCPWVALHDIGPGDKLEDVLSAYGEQEITEMTVLGVQAYLLQYYVDSKGNSSDYLYKAATISIHLDETKSKVESISISD